MTSRIHPTSVIHPKAELAEGVEVGPYVVIGDRVSIGARTKIGTHAVIDGRVEIGEDNHIFPGAIIGLEPQDVSYKGADSKVVIGDRNRIREYVTIHRPTQAEALTRIGSDNFLMAYAHIAHNCQIEDHVTIANAVELGGHVRVESRAVIGGLTGIHQWVHIGRCAMIGGMSRINRDVPPYLLVEGNPARVRGLNRVGLSRSGIEVGSSAFKELKQAYRLLYSSTLTFGEALETLSRQSVEDPLTYLVQFLQQAQSPGRRGAVSGRGQTIEPVEPSAVEPSAVEP
jgi:UDP-N-acetylglucosamine acyltransferase